MAPGRHALASGPDDTAAVEKRERCATRVSIALTGQSPSAELLANPNPQSTVDATLTKWEFVDRLARFLNATFNAAPGDVRAADAPYYVAVKVLQENKPYKDMFLGKYSVELADDTFRDAVVKNDPEGLGYFKSPFWEDRYAGNEKDGLRLMVAYRIQHNITGLDLTAFTAEADQKVDPTATGRKSPQCSACHYDHWYALDKVANVLGRVRLDAKGKPITSNPGNNKKDHILYTAPDKAEQLYGKTIKNERELVQALVDSPRYAFNTCRVAFKFLYGRAENQCEGELFDRCVDAFKADGKIQTAISTIAKDGTFCQ